MNKLKSTLFIISLLFSNYLFAQLEQKVNFDIPVYYDAFDTITDVWPVIHDSDNEFIVIQGEYYMKRKNKDIPYAILMKYNNTEVKFEINTEVKLAPSTEELYSIGILFMVQNTGKDAYIFELNNKKEYRLKQLKNGIYKYITINPTGEENGWIKNKIIESANIYNKVIIKYIEGEYSIYVNNVKLMGFYNDEYKYGGMGFIIGPNSLAKSNYFQIKSTNQSLKDFKIEPPIIDTIINKEENKDVIISDNTSTNNVTSSETKEVIEEKFIEKNNSETTNPNNLEKRSMINVMERNLDILQNRNDSLSKEIKQKDLKLKELDYFRKIALAKNDSVVILYFNKIFNENDSLKMYLASFSAGMNGNSTIERVIEKTIIKEVPVLPDDYKQKLFEIDSLKNINKSLKNSPEKIKIKVDTFYVKEIVKLTDTIRLKETIKETDTIYVNKFSNDSTLIKSLQSQNELKLKEINSLKNKISILESNNSNSSNSLNNNGMMELISTIKEEMNKNTRLASLNQNLNDSLMNLFKENQNLKIKLLEFQLKNINSSTNNNNSQNHQDAIKPEETSN